MNASQAKQIPIQEALAKLGILPVRKDKGGVEWVYNSPFRNEKEPSLFVNIQKNVWNDFGDIGGNLPDFIMRYQNTDFSGALSFLDSLYSKSDFKAHIKPKTKFERVNKEKVQTYVLDAVLPLKSPVLEKYLKGRSINISFARNYLEVVQFHNRDSNAKYFGLGIKNMSGDYEVRNPKLKTVIGSKDICFLQGKGRGEQITVFEGFMDFLSYLTDKNKMNLDSDVLILNSTKLVERAKNFISQKDYQKVYTFFDNDKAGQQADDSFRELSNQIVSCKHHYQNFKDYNDYWQNISKNINI